MNRGTLSFYSCLFPTSAPPSLQGKAYADLPEGTWYPAISLYTNTTQQAAPAAVSVNFGGDRSPFAFPPPKLEGCPPPRPVFEVPGPPPEQQQQLQQQQPAGELPAGPRPGGTSSAAAAFAEQQTQQQQTQRQQGQGQPQQEQQRPAAAAAAAGAAHEVME